MSTKEKCIHGMSIIIIAIVFIMLGAMRGVVLCPDSGGYINMDSMREPLYPLFLQCLRMIFGSDNYLVVTSWIQMILAIVSIAHFTIMVSKEYKIHDIYICVIYVIFLAFYILPIFASATGVVSFLLIWTEGLTYPMFILCGEYLLLAGSDLSVRKCHVALVYACFLSLTRSGLIPMILVVMLVRIYIGCQSGNFRREVVQAFLITLVTFVLLAVSERVYFFVLEGQFMSHTYGAITAMSNVVFVADEEDVELIDDPEAQIVFEEMYQTARQEGWLYDAVSEKGLIERASDVENSHDPIKFQAYGNAVKYIDASMGDNTVGSAVKKDQIAGIITRALFKENIGLWVVDYIGSCLSGFIRSIAFRPQSRLMQVYALVFYVLAGVGIYVFRKNSKIVAYLGIVILSILANVCAVSLVIMPLSRYMVYNLPFFYVGFVIMWCNRERHVE